jgi:hypothetical protein
MPLEKPGPDGRRRDGWLRHGRQWNKSTDGEQANLTRVSYANEQGSIALEKLEGHCDAAANPEFLIAVVAVENSAGVKRILDVPFGGRVAETGLDGVIDFAQPGKSVRAVAGGKRLGSGIIQKAGAVDGLQTPISCVQFPAFDLLEKSE